MHFQMHIHVMLLCIFFMQVYTSTAIPCDSCGNECASACGTKQFRTCCFNYLRKRTDPNAMKTISNKRLIDFIMLQGRALFTQNELSKERNKQQMQQQKQRQQQQQQQQLQRDLIFEPNRSAFSSAAVAAVNDAHRNGTLILEDIQAYYD